jgi:hypothetical protein
VLRRGALIALGLLLLVGCGGGDSVSKEDVQKQYEAIQSLAAEGALVADGAADGRTTDVFVRVHTSYLDEAARKVESQLSSARASGGAERDRVRAARLASRVAGQLARLGDAPGNHEAARRIQRRLERDASLAEREAG